MLLGISHKGKLQIFWHALADSVVSTNRKICVSKRKKKKMHLFKWNSAVRRISLRCVDLSADPPEFNVLRWIWIFLSTPLDAPNMAPHCLVLWWLLNTLHDIKRILIVVLRETSPSSFSSFRCKKWHLLPLESVSRCCNYRLVWSTRLDCE